MFRPMVERPVRRCEIRWLNNIYYAPELRDEHGRKVLISYDIHDAERITVRRPDGSVICEAVWDGNKREAFPVSAEYYKQQQRLKGMRKRAEEKSVMPRMRLSTCWSTSRRSHGWKTYTALWVIR